MITNERLDELAIMNSSGGVLFTRNELAAMIEQCREANRLRELLTEVSLIRNFQGPMDLIHRIDAALKGTP